MGRTATDIWEHATKKEAHKGNYLFHCKYCNLSLVGGASILRDHLVGASRRRRPCDKVPADVILKVKEDHESSKDDKRKRARKEETRNGWRAKYLDGRNRNGHGQLALSHMAMEGGPLGVLSLPAVEHSGQPGYHTEVEREAERAVARYFYAHALPHSHANSPYFKEMCAAINRVSLGAFVPPSAHSLGTSMLEGEREDLEKKVNIILKRFENTGCTLASSGWSDGGAEKEIVHVMALSEGSPIFLKSLDAGREKLEGRFIADVLAPAIDRVGPRNLVQIVMDDVKATALAEAALKDEYPHVFFTNCSAQCIGSIMRGMEQEEWVDEVLANSGAVLRFVQRNPFMHGLLKDHPSIQCLRPRATQVATRYIALERLLRLRRAMVGLGLFETLDQWLEAKTGDAAKVKELVSSDSFWQACEAVEACMRPLFVVLKNVDWDGPILGEVYEWMAGCCMELACIDGRVGKLRGDRIRAIVAAKWNDELHSPLHAVGRLLNPKWHAADFGEDMKCVVGFDTYLKKRVPEEERVVLAMQMKEFRAGTSGTFLMAGAMEQIESVKRGELKPSDWWFIWGAHTPELRRHAIAILSQCSSTSSCESTWGQHDTIYDKRRHNLATRQMQDLIFCNLNLWLVDAYFQQSPLDGTPACHEAPVEAYRAEDWTEGTADIDAHDSAAFGGYANAAD